MASMAVSRAIEDRRGSSIHCTFAAGGYAPSKRRDYNALMRALRRNDLSPRMEMMPLIDVIFLLLTFFIYNLLISVPVDALPLKFTEVSTGEAVVGGEPVQWVKIDPQGNLFFGREQVSDAELDARLKEVADDPARPTLYLVVDAASEQGVDRAPLLISLFERVKRAGVQNVTFVGQPAREGNPQ